MTLHRYFNSRDALLEATGLEMIGLSNGIIDEAIARHADPRRQLQEIIMQAAQMGERFHFLMHASEAMDYAVIGPSIEALDDRDWCPRFLRHSARKGGSAAISQPPGFFTCTVES